MEILRFGPGYRRQTSASGMHGVADGTIWSDPRARITEVALSRRGMIGPETSPHLGLFIVISGGGWVQVGEERSTIRHGEAVEWPADVARGAWTDGTEMRAILVELPDTAIDAASRRLTDDAAHSEHSPARGHLADPDPPPVGHVPGDGEPW